MKNHLLSYCCLLVLLFYASSGQAHLNSLSTTVNNVTNLTTMDTYATIQAAVDAANPDDVLEVGDGTYNENVIINKSLTLRSVNGRANVTIQGTDNGTLGTIFISNGVDNVIIGEAGKGFTIIGFDNDAGGVEAAAVYLQGAHDNITVQYNEIVADGEAGLLSEYNATIDNIIIDNNTFSGQTFTGAMPGGIGFGTQFDPVNNVPRQLAVLGGGEGVTNSQNVTFTNNQLIGVTGGISSDDGTSEQGNTLVTIDVLGATITGNTFAGTTARFGASLRVRGSATTVKDNIFDSSNIGAICSHAFFGDGSSLTGADADVDDIEGVLLNNTFDVAAGYDFTITPNVQGAIVAAPADAEVLVLPGTHVLNGQIVIDENRSVRGLGATKADVVFNTDQNTGTSGDPRGWFLVNDGIELSMSNLTLDGTGFLIYQAIRHRGSGTFDNIHFTEIKYLESGPNYQGVAIAVLGSGNVDVSNSMFDEIGRIGVTYFGTGVTSSTFSNNMYTGKGTGDHLDYAVEAGAGANATITGNTISSNKGTASSDGSKSAGILVSTFFGAGTVADITNNTITDNTCGVTVGFNESDASTVTINNNDIFNNTLFGVNSTNPEVDATSNWWGDASGPGGVGPGTGDAVSDNVAFCPWLNDEVGIGTLVPLPLVMTRDITLALDANGQVTIVPSQVNDGSTDGCGDNLATFELDITTFDCDDVGPNIVTLTVTDVNGLMASETATVTIIDNAAPLVIENCSDDIMVDNDTDNCSAVVNFDTPMAYDVAYFEGWEDPAYAPNDYAGWTEYNSDISRAASGDNSITSSSGSGHGIFNSTSLPVAPNDFSGAFARTGGYTTAFGEGYRMQIDVYMDLTDAAVAANTYGWDASSAASTQSGGHLRDFIFHTASNASGEILVAGSNNTNFTRRNDLASLNHYTITTSGWYTFEWDFRDAGDGSLAGDLNLYDDAGTLLFTETRNNASDDIATTVGGNRYTWFTFLAVDELAVDNATLSRKLEVTCDFPSGTAFPVGTTMVTCSATDACGNPVSCSFDIIVSDAQDPEITSCPSNITEENDLGECGAIVDFAAMASDNCDNDVEITYSHDSGTFFQVGTTTVTVTATDDAGNDVSCTFDVTVSDTEMPDITCPDDVTIEATTNCSPTLADYTSMAIVDDNCSAANDITVTQSPVAGTALAVGSTTTVTLTAEDEAGQTNTCTFDVTIVPTLSIVNADVVEGNAGTTSMFFTVNLSCASSETVTVDYATADNSATIADNDYTAEPTTTLTFLPGQTSKMIEVSVNGDTKLEADENFFVNLSSAVNAGITDDQGIGLILNDDAEPAISIADTTFAEGDVGTTIAQVRVSLSDVSSELITVNYATVNSSATTTDGDYDGKQGTLVFVPGDQDKFVDITINGDFKVESDETFFINLSMANNATIDDGQAVVTIENDDAPTTADAGDDQFDVCGTTTLDANAVNLTASETGLWTIANGIGGSFADATDPTTEFTGAIGVSYTLTWTITRGAATSSDNVFIQYSPDSDGDGVCDAEDICPGIDDNSEACNLDCLDNRIVMQAAVSSDVYLQADQTIATSGIVTIPSGRTVTFQAGESITLTTGFTAAAGSHFLARIDECSFNNNAFGGDEVSARSEQESMPLAAKELQLSVEPNPLNSYANLRFELPQNETIVLRILNAVGQEIARPHNKVDFVAGEHIYLLDAQNLAAGIYYVHLTTSDAQVTQKVIVTKR